jgi:hypothetical protein
MRKILIATIIATLTGNAFAELIPAGTTKSGSAVVFQTNSVTTDIDGAKVGYYYANLPAPVQNSGKTIASYEYEIVLKCSDKIYTTRGVKAYEGPSGTGVSYKVNGAKASYPEVTNNRAIYNAMCGAPVQQQVQQQEQLQPQASSTSIGEVLGAIFGVAATVGGAYYEGKAARAASAPIVIAPSAPSALISPSVAPSAPRYSCEANTGAITGRLMSIDCSPR